MDLDEIRQAWRDFDRKLDETMRLNTDALRASRLDRAQSALKRLTWWLSMELVVAIPSAVTLVLFAAAHRSEARFLALSVGLLACAIGLIASAVRQLNGIHRLDYGQPVRTIQKRVEALRVERIRITKLALLLGPLLWVPVLIVLVRGFFGVDLFATELHAWIVANLAFGLFVILAGVWASRRYAERGARWPLLQRLMRDLAGHNLNRATGFLRELDQLDQGTRS